MPSHYFSNLVKKAQGFLKGRKPMSATRKRYKRAMQEGPAGEQRNVRITKKSPVGKLQASNKRKKSMLEEAGEL